MRKVVLYFAILGLTTDWLSAQILDTIVIGNQVWMAKDLSTDFYANGDSICQASEESRWQLSKIIHLNGFSKYAGSWCDYNIDNSAEKRRLYNWYAVSDSRGLCPVGWHVATASDWNLFQEERKKAFIEKLEIEAIRDSIVSHPAVYKKETYFYETGGYTSVIDCPNCKSWNEEYMKKVPCHTCKDNRTVSGPYIPKTKQKGEREVLVSKAWEETIHKERPPMPLIPSLHLNTIDGVKSIALKSRYENGSYNFGGYSRGGTWGTWWIGASKPEVWNVNKMVTELSINRSGEIEKQPKSESYDPATATLGEKEKQNKSEISNQASKSEDRFNMSPFEGHHVRCVKGESTLNYLQKKTEGPLDTLESYELINSKDQSFQSKSILESKKWKCIIRVKNLSIFDFGFEREYSSFNFGKQVQKLHQSIESLDFIWCIEEGWKKWVYDLYLPFTIKRPRNIGYYTDTSIFFKVKANGGYKEPRFGWTPVKDWKETLSIMDFTVFGVSKYYNNGNDSYFELFSPDGKRHLSGYIKRENDRISDKHFEWFNRVSQYMEVMNKKK